MNLFLKRVRSLLGCLCLVLIASSMSAADHKNVLLICIDDLRPVMGCYGGAAKTPKLDELAKNSAVFTRHYNQWPVCGPSRASMLGGLRPDSTGIYEIRDSWKISKRPTTHPTLPRHFKDNGYRTLSFGKVYHGKGNGKGYGWSEEPWKLDWTCYVDFDYVPSKEKRWRPAYEIYDGPDSKHNDFQTADKVIQALEDNKDRPFFIAGGFYKPHLPFVAPKKYWDLYSDDEIRTLDPAGLPKGAADFMYSWTEIASYGSPDGKLFSGDDHVGEIQTRDMIHAYYACVSFIDAQVGRVLDALEKNGLADNTAVVIWGDHGFHLGDHGRWAKHTQFEQAMRCPLIVRLPGQQAAGGGETRAIVESVDIYTTLCEIAGLKTPDFVDGQSLVPVIEGTSNGKQAAFSQIRPVNRKKRNLMAYSVRTKDYRYVQWCEPDNQNAIVWRELYDHQTDPNETISLIADPQHADVVRQHEELVSENYASFSSPRVQHSETRVEREYFIGANISSVLEQEAEGTSWSNGEENSPDMVQIGNEISNGMLWPDGKVWENKRWNVFCELFQAGSSAAKEVDPSVKVMVHLACGGQNSRSRAFLDKALAAGAKFDIIGQSYHPKWHGTLEDLRINLTDLAQRYEQPIIVVEYSGPDFREIHDIVHGLPNGKGLGAFVWAPTKTQGGGLFDRKGNTKPSIDVYQKIAEDYQTPQNESSGEISR